MKPLVTKLLLCNATHNARETPVSLTEAELRKQVPSQAELGKEEGRKQSLGRRKFGDFGVLPCLIFFENYEYFKRRNRTNLFSET